ncbi:MAG: ATP-dependent Clp protease ATP-binding subunit, partial [Proteobacteria bacterium]|nr:ATP-dependent Clp protease ATP-binding subunit [Pseudomonadota bacterium]
SKSMANNVGSVTVRRAGDKLPASFNPLCLSKQKFPQLCTYGRNLLAAAAAGQIDPVIDREHEIDQLIDILNKRRSNNPMLVGEAGVGKTAIIEGLALKMVQSDAPHGLENHTIISLDYGAILCGTQLRGALQERIRAIKAEVNSAKGHIILFLDDIHNWLMTGSGEPGSDAAVELKMSLSRGELMCIGASTPMALRRAFNSDPAFERRFDFIEVKAPSAETSVRIIEQGIIGQYAAHHGITYESDAIREAVRLSERYIQERALPDKAISVLDRAGSLCKRSGDKSVKASHVASVIAQIAEIPVERLLMTEKQKLLKMESILSQRLIGHDANIAKIANVIRRNHAGFGGTRPIGSFLFLGPTGVGKTEAAKVLADFLFGSPKNMIRFDMSEYMEQHSVAKLIGAPAGYVGFDDGGLLTEALRKRPYQIVLFDEIEKAHPDIMNIFLQIFDEGKLTDAKGRHVDFSNTVIIMTSNLGAAEVSRAAHGGIGFTGNDTRTTTADAEKIIINSAKSRFLPELWNRIEEKLVFHPLTIRQIESIAHLLLSDSAKRLFTDKRIKLTFEEDSLIPYLIQNGGFDPAYGARPMRKTIQSLVESRVAEWILVHDDNPTELVVSVEDDNVVVTQAEEQA